MGLAFLVLALEASPWAMGVALGWAIQLPAKEPHAVSVWWQLFQHLRATYVVLLHMWLSSGLFPPAEGTPESGDTVTAGG